MVYVKKIVDLLHFTQCNAHKKRLKENKNQGRKTKGNRLQKCLIKQVLLYMYIWSIIMPGIKLFF